VDGTTKPADLVRMSPQDLADAQIKNKIQEIAEQVGYKCVLGFLVFGLLFF
jgi:hypothetical protein